MTVVFPSEFIARIAYRKYMRVRARGQRLRAIFSKPRSDARGTETVDQLTAQQKEDAAVQKIGLYATLLGGFPYVALDKVLELAAQRRGSGNASPQGEGSGRERSE